MRIAILLLLSSILGLPAIASDMVDPSLVASEISSSNSPEVCQFSLTSYTGTISFNGFTGDFKVGLSCPQECDVRATVVVFINGEHVASKVVTVKAGKEYSDSVVILVGDSYRNERYKLVVQ